MPKHFTLSLRPRKHCAMTRAQRSKIIEIWREHPEAEDRAVAESVGIRIYAVQVLRLSLGIKRRSGRKKEGVVCESEGCHGPVIQRVPAAVLAERERLAVAVASRDFSAAVFGDPPPGYSALDQKRAAT